MRDAFLHSSEGQESPADEAENAQIILFSQFLGFLATSIDSSKPHISVLSSALKQFTTQFLATSDVHSLTVAFSPDSRKTVLTGYFAALAALEALVAPADVPRAPQSALLEAAKSGNASIYGLFGGQGTNEVYFAELKGLYDIYKPYIRDLIAQITQKVLIPAAAKATDVDGFNYYAHGLDVLSWLEGPEESQPPIEYLASIPISFPVIGITQLAQYLIAVRVSNLTPEAFRALVHGATGHSQGIVSAVVLAASTTFESFYENAAKASTWLFYAGLRGQESFPVLAVEPRIVSDAIEGGEGQPTPMLAVSGLARSTLDAQLAKTNTHLPANSQLSVGLNNGPKNTVVVGPARALYGLVTALRKIRAPAGVDQSKVPFSQRKIAFSMRFLVVNVPYHSDYLKGATDKVFEVDLQGKELWTPQDLGIPVFHTGDGASLFLFYSFSFSFGERPTAKLGHQFVIRLDDSFWHARRSSPRDTANLLQSIQRLPFAPTDAPRPITDLFSSLPHMAWLPRMIDRLRSSIPQHLPHAFALRSDVHLPSPLGQGHGVPRDCYPCRRLWTRRPQRHRSSHCS